MDSRAQRQYCWSKKLTKFDDVTASKVRITLSNSLACPIIESVKLYKVLANAIGNLKDTALSNFFIRIAFRKACSNFSNCQKVGSNHLEYDCKKRSLQTGK